MLLRLRAAAHARPRAHPSQIKGDRLSFYGIGLVQNLDAATTELYVSWRHFEAKDPGITGTTVPQGIGLKDLDIVLTGARVKF